MVPRGQHDWNQGTVATEMMVKTRTMQMLNDQEACPDLDAQEVQTDNGKVEAVGSSIKDLELAEGQVGFQH